MTVHALTLGYLALIARHQAEGRHGKPDMPMVATQHFPSTVTVWSAISRNEWEDALITVTHHAPEIRAATITDALATFTSLLRQFPEADPFAVDPDRPHREDAAMSVHVIDPTGCTQTETCDAEGHYATCPKFSVTIPLTMQRWDPEPDPLDGNTPSEPTEGEPSA